MAGNIDDQREASKDEAENENPANTENIVQENLEAQSKSERNKSSLDLKRVRMINGEVVKLLLLTPMVRIRRLKSRNFRIQNFELDSML